MPFSVVFELVLSGDQGLQAPDRLAILGRGL